MESFIQKIFSMKRNYCKYQDVSNRSFSFSEDQVRVILFRECDFRGRKLLFDSQSVQRLPVSTTNTVKTEGFVEITNGYGYKYLRPSSDIGHLGEMVYGSVAMSYRGTSFKIHNFKSPTKLVCTQVFPSPRYKIRGRPSVATQNFVLKSNPSVHSFEKSMNSTSSMISYNEQVSLNSTESDIKLSPTGSIPLDVPSSNQMAVKFAPSIEGDSGFSGEQSYNSVSSGPLSLWDAQQEVFAQNFSCGSLYKRWLRSASTSLDNNSENSLSGIDTSISIDESMTRHRTSKLGLVIIIQLNEETEPNLEKFLLEHSALLEAMIYRARTGAESAYVRPSCFASTMFDVVKQTSQWLTDLIVGPVIPYLWHDLNAPIRETSEFMKASSESSLPTVLSDRKTLINSSSEFDVNRHLHKQKSVQKFRVCLNLGNRSSPSAEKFIKEFCELIESVDVKHTNFFISTLLTAVLTNHLGWVSSVLLPAQTEKDIVSNLHAPCNPLWGQLTDLYGAVGTPTKMAHTIICGSNKMEIAKILNTLTYFIRCSAVERNQISHFAIDDWNSYQKEPPNNKINKPNNFKMMSDKFQKTEALPNELQMPVLKAENDVPKLKMSRTKSCLENIDTEKSNVESKDHPLLDKITHLGIGVSENVAHELNLVDIKEASEQVRKIFSHTLNEKQNNVIFVLGDDEKLVGIKKSESTSSSLAKPNSVELNIPSCSKERPKDLKISIRKSVFTCNSSDSSPDDTPDICSPCSDMSPCSECEKKHLNQTDQPSTSKVDKKVIMTHSSAINLESCDNIDKHEIRRTDRSQSVPPSDKNQKKCSKNGCKLKYSGVKFNFKQYPQIVTNYMKSKNLEMSQLPFAEKALKLNRSFSASVYDCSKYDLPSCDCEASTEETLQTPSNASELEFTSELAAESKNMKFKEVKPERSEDENNAIFEHDIGTYQEKPVESRSIVYTDIPMPKVIVEKFNSERSGYTQTLLRGVSDRYVSDMVLQGTTLPKKNWEQTLKRDLTLEARKPLLDQPIQESVAIIANVDTWEVQLMSSHTFVVEKSSLGVQVGMSQLVANMLESLLHLWKSRTPPEYCLMHIESKLREFCFRSKSLAQLLLSTDFCNMDFLTSSLQLEVNDVPLLMAVASTHTPQVTQKYGLSFQ